MLKKPAERTRPTSDGVGGGGEHALQTSAVMMNHIVEVRTGLLLQPVLHLHAATLATARRWKEREKKMSGIIIIIAQRVARAVPLVYRSTRIRQNWGTRVARVEYSIVVYTYIYCIDYISSLSECVDAAQSDLIYKNHRSARWRRGRKGEPEAKPM